MTVFKKNMQRHYQINAALEPHGLELSGGVVIDKTLPSYMHSIVCTLNGSEIDLDVAINVLGYSKIADYINGGRERNINKFLSEQAEAAVWSNRPLLKFE